MQHLFFFLLLLFATILLSPSCTRCPEMEDPVTSAGPIRFDQLSVGQRSRYIGLEAENYHSGDGSEFTYSDDTLVLEIVGQDAQGFKVAETLHYVDSVSNWHEYDRDSTYLYYLTVIGDTLRLTPVGAPYFRSRLFVYYASSDGLPLANFGDMEVAIKGWKTDLPYCECRKTGFTKDYTLFGESYPLLNVLLDNTSMQVDGPGHTYVYSAEDGVVKFSQYSWWTSTGYGWDLLPE